MKIDLPAQDVSVDKPNGVDPIWYEKLQQIAAGFGRGLLPNAPAAGKPYTGFMYMPTCQGAPTGTPVLQNGFVPFMYDTTNNRLYVFNGTWRSVAM